MKYHLTSREVISLINPPKEEEEKHNNDVANHF